MHFFYGIIVGAFFFNVGLIFGIKGTQNKYRILLDGWKLIVSLQEKGIRGRQKRIEELENIIESMKKPE